MASVDDDAVATASASASASAIAAANQEDVLELMSAPAGATSTGAPPQQIALTQPLFEIFHDAEHFKSYSDENGKMRWRCGWCNIEFAGHNATKALYHIMRVKNKGIRPCKGSIPDAHYKRYIELYERKMGAKSTKAGKCYDCFLCCFCEKYLY